MADPRREQVVGQCDVVAHMALELFELHVVNAALLNRGHQDELIDTIGRSTAYLMEILSDILNGIEAISDEDKTWIDPIFAEAQRLWPVESET